MATPDVSDLVDLSLYDRTPADLLDQALADIAAKFPGFTPRVGSTERVLLEAMALLVAETGYGINRLPGAVTEVLLRLYGVERSDGVAATATATFTVADDLGYVIPVDTRLRLDVAGEAVTFRTDVALNIPFGDVAGTVAITAEDNTDLANGTAAGTALDLLDAVPAVNTVVLATPVANGDGPEGDVDYLERGVARLARLSDALVVPSHFTAFVLEDARVSRATTIDRWDAVNALEADGHVTVAVAGAGGSALAAGVVAELDAAMEAKTRADLIVHTIDPTVTAVDVTASVRRLEGYTDAEVEANVEAAIEEWLDPDAWAWDATVRRFELIAVLDRAEGVDYVESVTVPAADVALAGVAPLADAGALAITVTAP